MAVTVKFLADVASWVSGLGKSEDAVEDNQQALEELMKKAIELGQQTGRTTDEIAQDFSDAFGVPLDRAKSAIEEVTAKTDDLGTAADDAGSQMGDGISGGVDVAADSLSELGSIAQDVLAGDFEGATSTALDAVSGLAGSIPGIGIAVGAAAGVAKIAFDAMQADAAATEQRVSDMYDDMIASGERFVSADFIQKGIADIAGDTDKWNEALELSKQLGVDVNDIVRATAGDTTKANQLLDDQNAKREAEIELINQSSDTLDNKSVKIDAVNTKYGELTDGIYDVVAAEDSAAARATAAGDATSAFLMDMIGQAGEAQVEVDELGNQLVTLPNDKKILIDAQTGKAREDISAFKGDLDGKVPTVKTSTIQLQVDSSAYDRFVPARKTAFIDITANPHGNRDWNS